MEIRQLEVFVSVAKNLSFSKAAEELYISQPSVSAQIGSLEKELGSQLLTRNTKEVALTKAGARFLSNAQKILSLRDRAVCEAAGEDKNAPGQIDVISSTIPAQHLLPEMIAGFRERWPNVVFRVEQADSRRAQNEMGTMRYDFGMIGTVPDAGRFASYPVFDDELALALPVGAEQDDDTIRKSFPEFIARSPVIMRESGSGTRKEVEALLSGLGVDLRELRVPAYLPDADCILRAVSQGIGVSLVPKVAARMYVDAGLVRIVEMDDASFRRKIYLLHNKGLWLSPLQQAFVDHVRVPHQAGT